MVAAVDPAVGIPLAVAAAAPLSADASCAVPVVAAPAAPSASKSWLALAKLGPEWLLIKPRWRAAENGVKRAPPGGFGGGRERGLVLVDEVLREYISGVIQHWLHTGGC